MVLAVVLKIIHLFFKVFYLTIKTLPRDLKGLALRRKIDKKTKEWQLEQLTVAKQFRKNVKKHPNKAAIIFENRIWTFQDVRIIKLD